MLITASKKHLNLINEEIYFCVLKKIVAIEKCVPFLYNWRQESKAFKKGFNLVSSTLIEHWSKYASDLVKKPSEKEQISIFVSVISFYSHLKKILLVPTLLGGSEFIFQWGNQHGSIIA